MSLLKAFKAAKSTKNIENLSAFWSTQMGYRQKGVLYDDLIPEENSIMIEALRRLPPQEFQERLFRIRRMFQASATEKPLPKELWTKPEEDVPYLSPYITQVEKEIATKQEFDQLQSIPAALRNRNRSS
ncbi:cytochrome b-c1 complex subunit 7 [Cladochytrium replicatum]|nr:cytochrome b-c1 complex subunit 7 [Cladochytrium replicatum]